MTFGELMVCFRSFFIFLSNISIPTPAPVRGGPVDCIGGPVDCILGSSQEDPSLKFESLKTTLNFESLRV